MLLEVTKRCPQMAWFVPLTKQTRKGVTRSKTVNAYKVEKDQENPEAYFPRI